MTQSYKILKLNHTTTNQRMSISKEKEKKQKIIREKKNYDR